MTIAMGITIDCEHPAELARFWSTALGYVEPEPPEGFDTWHAWLAAHGVPEQEWDDGAYLVDPEGGGPTLSLMRVPEAKVVKNRVHLDLKVSGGRQVAAEIRTFRIEAAVERLIGHGGSTLERFESGGDLDHVLMCDPEGNEFCVL